MDAKTAPSIRALFESSNRPATESRSTRPSKLNSLDDDQEYEAYANGRIGTREQSSVEFRKSDGSVKAFTYTHLFSVESENPIEGFTATFSGTKVTVRGRNLRDLFQYVRLLKAHTIVEAGQAEALELGNDAPVVESIEFKR